MKNIVHSYDGITLAEMTFWSSIIGVNNIEHGLGSWGWALSLVVRMKMVNLGENHFM